MAFKFPSEPSSSSAGPQSSKPNEGGGFVPNVPEWERSADFDPCAALAEAGKQAFESGMPLPDESASGYTSSQYACFSDGYLKAEAGADGDSKGLLIFGGLAIVGAIGGLWYASKKRWI